MVKRIDWSNGSADQQTYLKKVLDEQTLEIAKGNKEARPEKHASDYGQCMRKVWFRILAENFDHEPEKISARVHRIFQNGHAVHDRLGKYLKMEPSLRFEEEVVIPMDELEVHGRCDGTAVIDNEPKVVEFKSINRRVVKEPKPEHRGQLTWYMTMWRHKREKLKNEWGYELDEDVRPSMISNRTSNKGRTIDDLDGIEQWLLFTTGEISGEIIYESKQTNQTHHFEVPFDEQYSDAVRLWFEQLEWHVQNKEIPHTDNVKSKFPCSWGRGATAGRCPYYEQCWGDDGIQKQEKFQ